MIVIVAGGLAAWMLAVFAILGVCRAAARADDEDARYRIAGASRRGVSIGMAAAVVTLPSVSPDRADAQRAPACVNRDVEFEDAPAKARHALACELARLRAKRGLERARPARGLREDELLLAGRRGARVGRGRAQHRGGHRAGVDGQSRAPAHPRL